MKVFDIALGEIIEIATSSLDYDCHERIVWEF